MTRTLDGILLDIAIVRMRFAVGIVTRDQDWDEGDHPRDEIGRFSLGAGSAADYQRVSEAHTKAAGEHRAASMFLDPESAGSAAHRTAADLHDTAATHYVAGSADPASTLKSLAATSMAVSASHQARAADPSRRRVHTPPAQEGASTPADTGPVIPEQMKPGAGTLLDYVRVNKAHDHARIIHEAMAASLPLNETQARNAHFAAAKAHKDARLIAAKVNRSPHLAAASADATRAAIEASAKTSVAEPMKMSEKDAKKAVKASFREPSISLKEQPARSFQEMQKMSAIEFADAYGIHVEDETATFNKAEESRINTHVRYTVAAIPKSHREKLAGMVNIKVLDTIDIGSVSATGRSGRGVSSGLYRGRNASKGFIGGDIEVARTYGLGSEQRDAVNYGKTTAHEIGHAIDDSIGSWSENSAFKNAIPSAENRGSPDQEKRGRYYHLNVAETWAECYAVEFGKGQMHFFGGIDRDTAKRIYAGPIAAMKKILADKGLT